MTPSPGTQPSPWCAVSAAWCAGVGVGVAVGEWRGPGDCVPDADGWVPDADGWAEALAAAVGGVVKPTGGGPTALFAWPTSAAWLVALPPLTTPFTAHASSPTIEMPRASAITRRRQ